MRTLIITLLALTATCAFGRETCDVSFINTGNLIPETTYIKGQNFMDVIFDDRYDWSAFIENGPGNVILKDINDNEQVTDLNDARVKARMEEVYKGIEAIKLSSAIADYVFADGILYDQSDRKNEWRLFARKQLTAEGEEVTEYIGQKFDDQRALFNVLESSGKFHHIFKHANGLISVVNEDCSIMTYARTDAVYRSIRYLVEELGLVRRDWQPVNEGELPRIRDRLTGLDFH